MTPDKDPDPSHELLDRLRRGDEEVFRDLVQGWYPRLMGFLMAQGDNNRDMADDIAQETFVALWQQRNQLRSMEALPAWLFRVAYRKARQVRGPRQPDVVLALNDSDEFTDSTSRETLQVGDVGALIGRELRHLSPHEQELVTLRYFGGLSYRELADITQSPVGSVGTQLTRALAKLRAQLEAQGLRPEDLLP